MMNRSKRVGALFAKAVVAGVLLVSAGLASALPFSAFQGRDADGSVNNTCTATGGTKCVMIYDSTLNITILNDWNIGSGVWDGSATPSATSAQGIAKAQGEAQTDFTGWRLPTGDGSQSAGSLNEYLSIWNDVGGSLAGLQSEFDGVQADPYWSGSEVVAAFAWIFVTGVGDQNFVFRNPPLFAVAVRSGDVVAAVPEPESLALVLVGLVAAGVARRRRPL